MAAIIGALRAELSASLAQWQSDMGKAADSLKGFQKTAEGVARNLDSVGKKMSLAITAPLALLAKAGLDQAKQSREAMGQVEAALTSTGGASGKTAAQLQLAAKGLQNLSTFDDDDILKGVTANLLTFGNIQGDVFDRAQKATVDLASRMGGDLQGAAIKVGRALQDPIKGISAFTRLGVSFTQAEQAQIKALVQHGQGLEAQGIILDKLATKFGGAAEAMRAAQPDAVLTQSWRDFEETIGNIEIKLLPPLTDALRGLVDWFNNLSPATQEWVVKLGAVLAIAGPVLVIVGQIVGAIGTLVPLVKGLASVAIRILTPALTAVWGVLSGISLATIGWVAALAAVVTAVVIFWKSIKDVLHGDFKKAWEDAKDTAASIAAKIKSIFASTPTGPTGKPGAAPATLPGGTPGKLDFNLDNAAEIKKAQDAAKQLQSNIDKMGRTIAQGLDATHLPQATTQANALNAQLDDYVKTAKEAGVNTGAFGAQIDALRQRITKLQAAGLEKEAVAFSREVDKSAIAVKRFAAGGLDPLTDKLDQVDAGYESIRDQIVKSIEDNAALAGSNDTARAAMERLQKQLAQLEGAHQAARDAATSQFKAEEALADLQTQASNNETANQIRDLTAARGGNLLTSHQVDLQSAGDQLQKQLTDVGQSLIELEQKRAQAAAEGFDDEVKRLDSEIDLQTQLYNLVHSTTADQLVAAKSIDQAYKDFTDGIATQLSDVLLDWKVDISSVRSLLRQVLADLLKPATQGAADWIGAGIKGLFAGVFDNGGVIGPGQWGIKSGMPEIIQGGTHGVSVMPLADAVGSRRSGGGDTYIDARGADSAAVTRLARVVGDLQRREGGRVKSYNADQQLRTR